jgi:hypothetical protein
MVAYSKLQIPQAGARFLKDLDLPLRNSGLKKGPGLATVVPTWFGKHTTFFESPV